MKKSARSAAYAYSAYSYFNPLAQEGPFQIAAADQEGSGGRGLEVAHDTLAKFVAEGPTQEELEAAKQNIIGGFPLRIDSNRKIHEYLSVIGFYRLPPSYLEDFPARIETRDAGRGEGRLAPPYRTRPAWSPWWSARLARP